MKQRIKFFHANLKYFKFRILKYILTFAGIFFGFSNTLFAQYGSWQDDFQTFQIKGRIFSANDSTPIPNVRINNNYYSDENGNFLAESTSDFSEKVYLSVIDDDGFKNKKFMPFDTSFICKSDTCYLDLYIKEEISIEQYLKENPQIPKRHNGKKIHYVSFAYVTSNYFTILIDPKYLETGILLNGEDIKNQLKPEKSDNNYYIEINNPINYLIFDKELYKNENLTFELDYDQFTILKIKKQHTGFIIINLNPEKIIRN